MVDYVWVSGNTFNPVTRATFTDKVKKKIVLSLNTQQHLVLGAPYVPPEPVSLPAYTFRFKFSNASYNPTNVSGWKSGCTWTQVTGTSDNVWDYTRTDSNWDLEFNGKFTDINNMVDIIAAGDMSGVTSMNCPSSAYIGGKVRSGTFGSGGQYTYCYIRSICAFNMSNVTKMDGLFYNCTYLSNLPVLDTRNVTTMWSSLDGCSGLRWVTGLRFDNCTSIRAMFANCNLRKLPDLSSVTTKLKKCQYAFLANKLCGEYGSPGILDAYNNLLRCNTSDHTQCFVSCGMDTPLGSAELSQVGTGWK